MRARILILSAFVATLMIAAFFQSAPAEAAVRAKGYTTKSGTRVGPSMRSSPDRSKMNNYSSKGRTNPYNGKRGTK